MKILTAQVYPGFDIEENKNRLISVVEMNDADVYVFPELYLTGYLIRDAVLREAISVKSRVMKEIAEYTNNKILIFGFPERAENRLYNSAAVIHDGNIKTVRKIYLPNFGPFEEKLYFNPGKEPFVLDTNSGKIGVQICYDAFFPEIAKIQALMGANIIVNISASPITSRKMFEQIIPARAIENTAFFVYVNWVGMQRTMEFWGGSVLYSPRGDRIYRAPYFAEDIHITEVDMENLKIAREYRPTLRDTVREFYRMSER